MKRWLWASLGLVFAGAAAAQPVDIDAAYRAGAIGAAQAALGARAPATDAERLIACRLALYANHVEQARDCLTTLRSAAPLDRTLLSLWAEASWRAGDYQAAARAREALGAPAPGERLRWFARHHPYLGGSLWFARRIPLERVDPLPVIKARLGAGGERYFLIDTGASDTIIEPALAAQAHVRTFGTSTGQFAAGQTAQTALGAADTLSLGGVTLRNVPVIVLDTSSYSQAAPGLHISGVIGTGLLSRFVATIDYPGGALVLRAHRASAPGDLAMAMWLLGDHFIVVEGAVNERPYAALIDTGLAGLACTMPRSTFEAIGARAGAEIDGGTGGAGEAVQVAPFQATLSLGALARRDQACVLGPFPAAIETLGGTHLGVLISHAFLRPYAVTFDFQHMRLVVTPSTERAHASARN